MKYLLIPFCFLLVFSCSKGNESLQSDCDYPKIYVRNNIEFSNPIAFEIKNDSNIRINFPNHFQFYRDTFTELFSEKNWERFFNLDSIIILDEQTIKLIDNESISEKLLNYKIEDNYISMPSDTNPIVTYNWSVPFDSLMTFGYRGKLGTYVNPQTNREDTFEQYSTFIVYIGDIDSVKLDEIITFSKEELEGTLKGIHRTENIQIDTIIPIFVNFNYKLQE